MVAVVANVIVIFLPPSQIVEEGFLTLHQMKRPCQGVRHHTYGITIR